MANLARTAENLGSKLRQTKIKNRCQFRVFFTSLPSHSIVLLVVFYSTQNSSRDERRLRRKSTPVCNSVRISVLSSVRNSVRNFLTIRSVCPFFRPSPRASARLSTCQSIMTAFISSSFPNFCSITSFPEDALWAFLLHCPPACYFVCFSPTGFSPRAPCLNAPWRPWAR